MMTHKKVITFISGGEVSQKEHGFFCAPYYGKIISELSKNCETLNLVVRESVTKEAHSHALPENVQVFPVKGKRSAFSNLLSAKSYKHYFNRANENADLIIIRGIFAPGIRALYKTSKKEKVPLIHWIVSDPLTLLKSHKRRSFLFDKVAHLYAILFKVWIGANNRLYGNHIAYLCNGTAIKNSMPGNKNLKIVSSTLENKDLKENPAGRTAETTKIMCLCYIRPEKGLEDLIQASKYIKAKTSIQINIYGPSSGFEEYQEALLASVRNDGLEEIVKFHGYLDPSQFSDTFSEHDIFILPSLSEGTPRVILEAMAKKTPVIATNVGGIPDLIGSNRGILIEPRSPQQIGDAVTYLTRHPSKIQKLTANAYEFAKSNTIHHMIENILRLGESLK